MECRHDDTDVDKAAADTKNKPTVKVGDVELSPEDARFLALFEWTMAEVKEFQAVWETIKEDHDNDMTSLGVSILLWLTENIPGANNLFQAFDTKDPRFKNRNTRVLSDRFMQHAIDIVFDLDKIITTMDEPSEAYETMTTDVRLHIGHGIPRRSFESMRDRFHLFLNELDGTEKDSRSSVLWFQFLNAFTKVFDEEEKTMEVKPETKERGCCCVL